MMRAFPFRKPRPHPSRHAPRWPLPIALLPALLLTLLAALANPAHAQDSSNNQPAGGGSSGGSGGVNEVSLDVDRFGLGGEARPGEIAAVHIRATDQSIKPREVLLRLEGRDPDGDTPLFERQVVLNPGVVQGVWLYPLLPRNFDTTDAMTLSAYEVLDSTGTATDADDPARKVGALGRLLGRNENIRMTTRISPYDSVIGVVGAGSLGYGLGDYAVSDGQNSWAASSHELTRIIDGIRISDLPDRWIGYSGIDCLVWGSGDPLELRGDRASALREWVQRGGHLVVIMPIAAQAWTNADANELYDLLPNVSITRHEGVDMEPMRQLLTRKNQARLPKDAVVYTFTPPANAEPADAIPILTDRQGRCVVARRLVGSGNVTLIGMDLNHRLITSQDLVNADIFWNRILGRRGRMYSTGELAQLNRGIYGRDERMFEGDISREISKSGRSATGLLLALIVFALYWLVAGPGGYTALKRYGLLRHSWLAFFGAAGIFTAIAWGGALLLRPARVDVSHLTILDHVYGQPTERARSWMSVLIPWYGQATMEVGAAPTLGDASHGGDVLMPWTSPDQAQAGQDKFPDARGYEIQTKSPRSLTVPTRSTVKQVRADWSGGPPWKMPMPVPPDSALTLVDARRAAGVLTHELPGPLHDVTIIIVRGQTPIVSSVSNAMLATAHAYSLRADDPWDPGEPLDLGNITNLSGEDLVKSDITRYFEDLIKRGISSDVMGTPGTSSNDTGVGQRLIGLGFISQFEPPAMQDASSTARPPVARRAETHGWDMGIWFTQPCIIILGHLGSVSEPMPSPVPFKINGETATPTGRTLIRWVYPLPANPPEFRAEETTGPTTTNNPNDPSSATNPNDPR